MRHAFMIAAHHQFEILLKTLQILDDYCVDFYIHIDSKSKTFPKDEIVSACHKSKMFFIDRMTKNFKGKNNKHIDKKIKL